MTTRMATTRQVAGNGANNGNGNGRNGGRGRGRPDPEAMKKVMEDPQIQAQMAEMRTQGEKLDNVYAVAVNKVLSARQRTLYKKMLGPPFDRSKMGGGGPWGGTRGNTATAKGGAAAAKTTSTAKANWDDDDADEACAGGEACDTCSGQDQGNDRAPKEEPAWSCAGRPTATTSKGQCRNI